MAQDGCNADALVYSIRALPAQYDKQMRAVLRQVNKYVKAAVDCATGQLTPRVWPSWPVPCLDDISSQQPQPPPPFPHLTHLDLTQLPTSATAPYDTLHLLRWLAPTSNTGAANSALQTTMVSSSLTSLAVPFYVTPASHKTAMLQHISGLGGLTSLTLVGATTSCSVFEVPMLHLAHSDLHLVSRCLERLHTLNLTNIQAEFSRLLDLSSLKELSLTCCTCLGSSAAEAPAADAPNDVDAAHTADQLQEPLHKHSSRSSLSLTLDTATTSAISGGGSSAGSNTDNGSGMGHDCSSSSSSRSGSCVAGGRVWHAIDKYHCILKHPDALPAAGRLRLVSLSVRRCHLGPVVLRAIQQGASCLQHVQLQRCGLR